jgi:2-keto-4-pentenoate hydratase/2-oxohepta-3-ene-1,7-dioic acid hydratase in catechol pathway
VLIAQCFWAEFQLERRGEWDKSKSCEMFNPRDPWLVAADAIDDPQNLVVRPSVNRITR